MHRLPIDRSASGPSCYDMPPIGSGDVTICSPFRGWVRTTAKTSIDETQLGESFGAALVTIPIEDLHEEQIVTERKRTTARKRVVARASDREPLNKQKGTPSRRPYLLWLVLVTSKGLCRGFLPRKTFFRYVFERACWRPMRTTLSVCSFMLQFFTGCQRTSTPSRWRYTINCIACGDAWHGLP